MQKWYSSESLFLVVTTDSLHSALFGRRENKVLSLSLHIYVSGENVEGECQFFYLGSVVVLLMSAPNLMSPHVSTEVNPTMLEVEEVEVIPLSYSGPNATDLSW